MNGNEIAKAAFVALYDVYVAGKSVILPQEVEDVIYRTRRQVNLSRKEAQYILGHPDTGDSVEAALVLAYEGIGSHRMEDDFSFDSIDILTMNTVRKKARISADRAISILKTSIGDDVNS